MDSPSLHPNIGGSTPLSELGKILVVDDDETNRLVVRVLMERRNYHVSEAASGPEAIDLVKAEPFDVVLMDLSMPGMDGFEAARRIREHNADRTLPVVALTAHTSQQHQTLCRQEGMNAVLRKPLDAEQLDRLMALLKMNVKNAI